MDKVTLGQKISDFVAKQVRSWNFVIFQMLFIGLWMLLNKNGSLYIWDKYPYDMLKLILTIEASFTASMILMNQNRNTDKDRQILHEDHAMQLHMEEELKKLEELLKNKYS